MSTSESYCGHCGKAASRRCGSCKSIHYCTIECQQADWSLHKLLCKQVAAFEKKPSEDVRRAILLPETSDKPVFTWLPVDDERDEDDNDYVTEAQVDFSKDLGVPAHDKKVGLVMPAADHPFLGPNDPKEESVSLVCGKKGCGELLGHSVTMMMREDHSKSSPNKCLAALAGDLGLRFCGPIVFLRQSKVENSNFTFDITSADFTFALDGLFEYDAKTNNNLHGDMKVDLRAKVLGVKLSQNPQRL